MINFEKVRFKNFGSFGNTMTEIVLNKNNATLICGNNGSGKSFAFLDSITFALFGKPFRKINIPQLVNSVNEKGCLVEIEFTRGSDSFMVRRGISPRIFEIYKNNELLNQDAKSLDYQEVLEQQILKMNYKTFTQVVILGSSSFVPFMQLSAADRRSVIENILDINIFSTMNVVLKGKILSLKENIKDVVSRIEIEKNKISIQTSLISTLEKKNNEDNEEKESRIKELEEKINEISFKHISHRSMSLEGDINTSLGIIKKNKDKIKVFEKNISDIEAKQKQKQLEISFFQDNHVCPTCSQSITDKLKKEKILSNNLDISNYDSSLEDVRFHVSELEKSNLLFEENLENSKKYFMEYKNELATIDAYKKEIAKIQSSINKTSLVGDIHLEKEKLAHIQGSLEILENEKTEYSEDLMYHEMASELMRDGGVKTKIIRHYLPLMNKYINKFLSSMDFFVHFDLDEEFNENIKSRYRDDFSYMNFSEGEKMRIDLALLLAWREVARFKNSINCNLLILDEVFDSSLDSVGMDELMKLLKIISDKTNVYVISHKADQLIDKFNSVDSFEKKNNFSKMINT